MHQEPWMRAVRQWFGLLPDCPVRAEPRHPSTRGPGPSAPAGFLPARGCLLPCFVLPSVSVTPAFVLSFPSRPGQAVLASCWAWHREGAQRTVCECLKPCVDGTRAAQGTELSLQPAVPLRWIQRGAPRSVGASSPAPPCTPGSSRECHWTSLSSEITKVPNRNK